MFISVQVVMFGKAETNIRKSGWTLPALARTFLISCEYESQFSLRTGNHIEQRPVDGKL